MRQFVVATMFVVSACEAKLEFVAPPPLPVQPEPNEPDGCDASESARPAVRRLTSAEVRQTLQGVLGSRFDAYATRLFALNALEADPLMTYVAAYGEPHTESQVQGLIETGYELARAIAESPGDTALVFDSCLKTSTGHQSRTCWERGFDKGVRKLWRRNPTAAERDHLFAIAAAQPSGKQAVMEVLLSVLLAPDFAFHIEEGDSGRITDEQLAARIAYATTGAGPDDTLVTLAHQGALSDLAVVREQTERLLATGPGRDNLELFVNEWLKLDEVMLPHPRTGRYEPNAIGRTQPAQGGIGDMGASYYNAELLNFFNYVVWNTGGDFATLMTAPIAFPAKSGTGNKYFLSGAQMIYETSGYAETQTRDALTSFEAKGNPGLLFRAALLTTETVATQPIRRGVRLMNRFLCRQLPSPGLDIVIARNEQQPLDPMVLANHQIVTEMTSSTACVSCHAIINPAGFIFEAFDIVGRRTSHESVRNAETQVLKTHPLPSAPHHIEIERGQTSALSTPDELATAVANSALARECMATYFFHHQHRRAPTEAERCTVRRVAQSMRNGRPLKEAFVDLIANDEIFWRRP